MSHITTTNQAVSHKGGVEDLRVKIKGLSKAGIEVGNKKHFNEQEVNPKKHFNKQAEAVAAAMRAAVRGQDVQKLESGCDLLSIFVLQSCDHSALKISFCLWLCCNGSLGLLWINDIYKIFL